MHIGSAVAVAGAVVGRAAWVALDRQMTENPANKVSHPGGFFPPSDFFLHFSPEMERTKTAPPFFFGLAPQSL